MSTFLDPAHTEFDHGHVTPTYEAYRDAQGVPSVTGWCIDDVADVETGPWEATGQRGALANLYGAEGVVDLHVHEIEPEGETNLRRHYYEEIVYVTHGNGFTTVGGPDEGRTFEWGAGSLFFLPKGVPYRHVNSAGDAPARMIAQTMLPHYLQALKDEQLLFDPPEELGNRDVGEAYYSGEGTMTEGKYFPVVWDANFVPDIGRFDKLEQWDSRGAGGASVRFPFPETSMFAHISEFPVGTYKKAHRHGPGAHVVILSGEGYSLLWRDGMSEKLKVPWDAGTIFPPPAGWYHQHFNTGTSPARYFAIDTPEIGTLRDGVFCAHSAENQIEYVNEDPAIRAEYEAALAEVGLESNMPEDCYDDPDFQF